MAQRLLSGGGDLMKGIVVEKSLLKRGEPVVGEAKEEGIEALLIVLIASNLRGGPHQWEVLYSYRKSVKLDKGRFEIECPAELPPAVYSKNFKVRWSLIFGIPRFGGRFMWPRKELRLKIMPSFIEVSEEEHGIRLERSIYRPGDLIKGEFELPKGDASKSLVGIKVKEWLVKGKESYSNAYILSEGDITRAEGRHGWFEIEVEKDITRPEDVSYFYPYTFRSKFSDMEMGISSYIVVENPEFTLEREIVIIPVEPRIVRRELSRK
ncbi:MAG: hypothetical protein ACP5LQ_04430 [Candidatus Methanodesulfokora sp.]